METRKTDYAAFSNPYWKMHRDLEDAKRGLLSFDELRAAWVAWAKHEIEALESQADHGNKPILPDSQPTDTTV
jgi:hypothetical protein